MAYVRVWIHCVWGTKKRTPFLLGERKNEILNHIKTNAKTKIFISILLTDIENIFTV